VLAPFAKTYSDWLILREIRSTKLSFETTKKVLVMPPPEAQACFNLKQRPLVGQEEVASALKN